jgi:serine/threonine protein kinase
MSRGGMPKYILGERIAQGGMAEIYLGKIVGSEGFTRLCAFKKILPSFAQDSEFMEMFRNEAMLAKMLQNKNIVQVYDFESDFDSGPMLVMEYVDGQDLRAILREAERCRTSIPIELAVYMAAEVLSGLAYAHSAVDISGRSLGIIHRDVSPQNILVSFEGDVKITDFGIAKAQSSAGTTRAGVLKGKFRYMAPEQAKGEGIDLRCDIFAMGIVLYEMLTMTRLFKGEDDLQVLHAVRDCKVRSPNEVKGVNIPAELESLVLKLLAKDPLNRFQTGREASKELTRFLYSYRKDFFAGELSDFMQKLFASKLESARDRMRSTLALPADLMRATRADSGYRPGILGEPMPAAFSMAPESVVDGASQKRNTESPVGWDLGTSDVKGGDSSPQIVLDLGSARPTQSSSTSEAVKSSVRISRSIGNAPGRRHSQAAQKIERSLSRSKSSSGDLSLGRMLTVIGVLFFLAVFAFVAGVRTRYLKFPTVVEFRQSMDAQKRVRIVVDGQPFRNGGWQDLPVRMNFEWGPHVVVFSKPGFRDQRITVNAPLIGNSLVGSPRSEVVLLGKDAAIANVLFLVDPSGTKITLDDGMFHGVSGKQIEFVPVGRRYRVRLDHVKCSPLQTEFELPSSAAGEIFTKRYVMPSCRK